MFTLEPVCARPLRRIALLLLLAVAGCANRSAVVVVPDGSPPPFSAGGDVIPPNRWWTTFGDVELDRQIDKAFGGSFTLSAAVQRLRAARALARREASDLWPDLDGVADIGSVFGPGDDRTSYTVGLDASYQVDLWGQIESRVHAEELRADATYADYQSIALTLSAEVARTWFALIESHAQLELLDEQLETNRTGATLQESRFGLGQVRSADVLRQRQLVESTLEQAVIVRARIEILEHELAVLLGQPPQEAGFETGAELPMLPPLPDTGVPSELLSRRPDVRRDLLAFRAADRDLASAITAQYPRLSLTGSILNVADRPETLLRDWFVSIGGQLIGPIVDGGQRRAEVDRTTALVRQRFDEYSQTTLNALREVEDSLALERNQLDRIERLEKQVELARQASEQLREQYLIGDTDYLNVLSAITSQQRLQRDTLSARLELLLIRIGLYLALAGDVDACPQEVVKIQEVLTPEELDLAEESTADPKGNFGMVKTEPTALAAGIDAADVAPTGPAASAVGSHDIRLSPSLGDPSQSNERSNQDEMTELVPPPEPDQTSEIEQLLDELEGPLGTKVDE